MNKYKNKTSGGFDSIMEKEFNSLLIDKGIEFETQKKYILQDSYTINGKKRREITYTLDFYLPKLEMCIDIKGFETEAFKIKKKLFENKYGDEILCITKCPKWAMTYNKDAVFYGYIDVLLLKNLKSKHRKK